MRLSSVSALVLAGSLCTASAAFAQTAASQNPLLADPMLSGGISLDFGGGPTPVAETT